MSDQQTVSIDSPRRHQLDVTPRNTQETNTQSDQTPRSHQGSQGRVSESPRQHLAPLVTPVNMPVEILSRPALPHGPQDRPWQGKHYDERLPSVRSLIHLPPLEPTQPLYPLPLPTPTSTVDPIPPARRSWPIPPPMGPPAHHTPNTTHLSTVPESLTAHRFDHVAIGPPRSMPSRPQSMSGVSPVSYTTSPRVLSRHEQLALSPDMRASRRASPPQTAHSHFLQRSPGAEAEHQRREQAITGRVRSVLRVEFIPERGQCYVYDDGSICEVSVGGERVNPDWGLTRAGRPRKRLAKACNNCREKKVRCEPGETRCVRCARQGEECKWSDDRDANATNTESSGQESRHTDAMPLTPPYSLAARPAYDPTIGLRDDNPRPAKRKRSNTPPRPTKTESSESVHRHVRSKDIISPRGRSNENELDMKYDPFRTDPTSASRLMTLFFSSSLCGSSTILPQEHLLRYAKTGDKVSTKERLFICTTLALGSLFSHDKALRTLGIQLASWAVAVDRETCFTHTNLSVILARLNLALYYFAVDEHDLFQHYLSVGLSDLKKLGLNVEGGAEVLTTSSQDTFSSLGLPTEERVEAMRRAFWLGFLAERLCVPTTTSSFALAPEDTFVRLPSSNTFYQTTSIATSGPLFDGGIVAFTPPRPEELGTAAHTILITSILGDVLSYTRRSSQRRSLTTYPNDYANFYAATIRRLGEWEGALPPYFRQHGENTILHVQRGDLTTYLTIHTIYHTAAIYLHRYVRHALLPPEVVRRNIQQATAHAFALLDLFNAVVRAPSFPDFAATSAHSQHPPIAHQQQHLLHPQPHQPDLPQSSTTPPRENPLTLPLLPHAAILATDVLSCAGTVERHLPAVLHLLQSAHTMIAEVSGWLGPAKHANEEIVSRIVQCRAVGRGTWRMERALNLSREGDVEGEMKGPSGSRGRGHLTGFGVDRSKEFDVFYGVDEWTLQQTRGDFVVS